MDYSSRQMVESSTNTGIHLTVLRLRNRSLFFASICFLYFWFGVVFPLQPIATAREYTIVEELALYITSVTMQLIENVFEKYKMSGFVLLSDKYSEVLVPPSPEIVLSGFRLISHLIFISSLAIRFVGLINSIQAFDDSVPYQSYLTVERSSLSKKKSNKNISLKNESKVTENVSRNESNIEYYRHPSSGQTPTDSPPISVTRLPKSPYRSRAHRSGLFSKCMNICNFPCADGEPDDNDMPTSSNNQLSVDGGAPKPQLVRGTSLGLDKETPSMWDSPPPHFSTWKTPPIHIRMVLSNPLPPNTQNSQILIPREPILVNVPYEFETEMFKGSMLIRIKNMDNDNGYFEGKRRVHQCVVQGRFKQEFSMDEMWGGQVFRKTWKKLPPYWVVRASLTAVKILAPTMMERLLDDESPFVVYPYVSLPQKLSVNHPGSEPDMTSITGIPEDCTLIGGDFKENGTNPYFRRRYFTKLDRLKNFKFYPDLVYTFEDYQDLFDFKDFVYKIRITSIDMTDKLVNEPVEMCAMRFKPSNLDRTTVEEEFARYATRGRQLPYFWRLQVWNKRCLTDDYANEKST